MKNRISAWIVLGVITIVAGLGLAVTNEVTKKPIAEQAAISEEKAKLKVMPGATAFEEVVLENGNTLFIAKNEAGEVLGYVGKSESKGYGGPVEVITGVKADGTVTGINVGGTTFAETPGLGAKALEDDFTAQFAGKTSPVRLGSSTNGNEVDSITAATRTSNAVLVAVNAVAKEVNLYLNPDAGKDTVAEGTPYAGEAEGFAGPVAVVVTVKDDGTISGLTVGDERFAETDGYGALALDSDFGKQFVGKTFPLSQESVDGISGATITTKAVIEAANQAFESKNVVLPEGTTYLGEADGFAGPVAVTVSVKDDGTISALKIGDDRFAETDGYGAAALEADFAAQFVGKSVPVSLEDIDAISGATMTSKAVVDAINTAVESNNVVGENTAKEPVAAEPTAEPVVVAVPENALSLSKEGFAGPVNVTLTFDEKGAISFMKIGDDQFAETKGFGLAALEPAFNEQFIGKIPPLTVKKADEAASESNFDGISGATVTTNAVLNAINELHAQQFPVEEMPAEPVAPDASGAITVVKPGFMGDIKVTVSFNEDKSIASVSISPEKFWETKGYGQLAMDSAYLEQFVGKMPPLRLKAAGEAEDMSTVNNITNVDAFTSATVTAQGIVDAINEAFTLYGQNAGNTISKQGFMGEVKVSVAFNEDGTIKEVKVLEDGFAETDGYGAMALEEGFAERFVGKLPPLTIKKADEAEAQNLVDNLVNPDTQSGATVTMQAIVDAINEAANKGQ